MANVYTNYKANLSTTALTTIYTVGTATSALLKSIRVSNQDTENNCNISLFLVDSSGVSYPLEIDRNIQAKRSRVVSDRKYGPGIIRFCYWLTYTYSF